MLCAVPSHGQHGEVCEVQTCAAWHGVEECTEACTRCNGVGAVIMAGRKPRNELLCTVVVWPEVGVRGRAGMVNGKPKGAGRAGVVGSGEFVCEWGAVLPVGEGVERGGRKAAGEARMKAVRVQLPMREEYGGCAAGNRQVGGPG